MTAVKNQQEWIYDPGEHRDKHCGSGSAAEFTRKGSTYIGLCPHTLTKTEAEGLLRKAEFPNKSGQITEYPKRVWNVHHDGVIYEASPTDENKASYHGYPWRGRPGRNRLPREVERSLRNEAAKLDCLEAFEKWLKEHNA